MEKIASFQVDHTRLTPGMYTSRTDGDVVTYDVRFIKPNTPPYLDPPVLHTIEHLVATYVRNSSHKDGVIYFGPMGCRTGFYFLTRGIGEADAIALMRDALAFTAAFEEEIPGASAVECGNCDREKRRHNGCGRKAPAPLSETDGKHRRLACLPRH